MNKKKIAAAGVIVLALAGIGSGAAMAATPAQSVPSSAVSETANPGTPETPDSESALETPGTEVSTPDDGNDGGHADADGVDVNNEGGAVTK